MRKPSSLIVVTSPVVAAVVAVVVGAAFFLLSGDDPPPANGDLIAFSCKEPKNPWYAICLMNIDGAEKTRVTSTLPTTDPAWSPDGRRIAFTRNEDVGEFTTFTDNDVFMIDADGGNLRQLTPERDGTSSGQPTWSPDGREIAFVTSASVASTSPSRFGSLHVMRADGTDIRRLTRGSPDISPAWSPDGREIAFSRGVSLQSFERANSDIFVMALTGGAPRRLTRTPPGVFETAPAWSPDGARIVFARWTLRSEFNGKAAIYVMNRDGSGERLVLAHQHFPDHPYSVSWSPDGRTIAFETSPAISCTTVGLVPRGRCPSRSNVVHTGPGIGRRSCLAAGRRC